MIVYSDLEKLLQIFPDHLGASLQDPLRSRQLLEIILDLGRRPEGRFVDRAEYLTKKILNQEDLNSITKNLGIFDQDNRTGIQETLHRISCIRNKQGIIIGLTCRIGRCLVGTIGIIRDLLNSKDSLLILGKPGTGKTTLIREISRVLSDEVQKRVIIIDTSNEIAGDSDLPHMGIGQARRMQVSPLKNQHEVMIEAIENHMPEVIIIDEIGTDLEVIAARSIAERGVQLIGTAHGNSLESLIKNPSLTDLVGGIQSVTLSDEEARRRGSQKTLFERKSFAAFQVAIELHDKNLWIIHENLEKSVDLLLQGLQPKLQSRSLAPEGHIQIKSANHFLSKNPFFKESSFKNSSLQEKKKVRSVNLKTQNLVSQHFEANIVSPKLEERDLNKFFIYPYHLSVDKINSISRSLGSLSSLTKVLNKADVILASKKHLQENPKLQDLAKEKKIPVYTVKHNTISQITNVLKIILKEKKC